MKDERKRPYMARELFEEIIRVAGKMPECIDSVSANNALSGSTFIKYYEFNIETVVEYGSCEGCYLNVYIKGRYDEEINSPRLYLGSFSSLNASDDAIRELYAYAAELFIKATQYINENIDDFSWLGYRLKLSTEHNWAYEISSEEAVIRKIRELNRRGENIKNIVITDLSTRKVLKSQNYIERALEVVA